MALKYPGKQTMGLLKYLTSSGTSDDLKGEIERYLLLKAPETQKQYRRILSELSTFLHPKTLRACTDSDAFRWAEGAAKTLGEPYRGTRERAPITRATLARKVVILRGFFEQLRERGIVSLNPFNEVHKRLKGHAPAIKRPTAALTPDQAVRLLNAPHIGNREGRAASGIAICLAQDQAS